MTAPDLPSSPSHPSSGGRDDAPVANRAGQPVEVTPVDVADTSFDGFFAAHHDRMVRALSIALGDDHLARDAASEGFAKALQRWNRVQNYTNPSGWVYRVGVNWARSRRRRTRREVGTDGIAPDVAAHPSAPFEPGLAPALANLSIEHRAVVVARYYLDWSEAQIAEALDIKPGTVKSRLSRAITELSTALGVPRVN